MNKVLNVYKPISKTPLQVINQLKLEMPEYADQKISYAGRLDPLAHGVLILLVGDENQNRREHEKLSKIYEFKCVLGFSTDTYDVLGLPEMDKGALQHLPNKDEIVNGLNKYTGTFEQELPPFSSYQINRIPLFKWARMGRLNEIQIPKRDVTVSNMELLEFEHVPISDLIEEIKGRITVLDGDFRQEEIIRRWEEITKDYLEKEVVVISCRASVTSGTYIRSICHELGKDLRTGGVALEIYRPQAGKHSIDESIKLKW